MSYKTNSGKIVSVEFVPAGPRVARPAYVITTDNAYGQTTHWVSPAFVASFMARNEMAGLTPRIALRKATATWQEKAVKAGDPVIDLAGKPVLDANNNPRIHDKAGYRTEQLRCVVGEELDAMQAKMELKESTKARFSGINLIAQFGGAAASAATNGGSQPEIAEVEGKSVEQLEAEALANAEGLAKEGANPKVK